MMFCYGGGRVPRHSKTSSSLTLHTLLSYGILKIENIE